MRAVTLCLVAAVLATAALNSRVDAVFGPDDPIQEGQMINFDALLFNPLMAVIHAQALSAAETLRFVNTIGFSKDNNGNYQVVLAEFGYDGDDDEGNPITGKLKVPLLCMVPIPYLRIEAFDYFFSTKLSSSYSAGVATDTSVTVGAGFAIPMIFSVSASVTVQHQFSSKFTASREYSMKVGVRAVQAPLPEGTAKVLDKLKASLNVHTKPASGATNV